MSLLDRLGIGGRRMAPMAPPRHPPMHPHGGGIDHHRRQVLPPPVYNQAAAHPIIEAPAEAARFRG